MKKSLYFLFIFLMPIISLLDCTSAKIVSNKDVGFNKKLKKIFVFINATKDSKSFWKGMADRLTNEFKQRGIESVFYLRDPLSLETDEDFSKKVSAYGPDGLLIIKQTVTSGDWRVGDYELSIIDGETKKS
ncbi:MAG: hypothetical protein ABI863_09985, partial [Ginsengibacter sp.]